MKDIGLFPLGHRFRSSARQFALLVVLAAVGLGGAADVQAADPVPVPWNGMDIGGPAPSGGAQFSGGTFTLTAGGTGLSGASDQFHFVYQSVTGDFALAARISFPSGSGDAAAGLMVRDALAATSNFVAAVQTPRRGVLLQYRTPFIPRIGMDAAGTPGSLWLRLVKRGTVMAGYLAPDMNNAPGVWKRIGGDQPTASGMVYAGLFLAGSQPRASCQATFDHVSFATGLQPLFDDGVYTISPVGAPGMGLVAVGSEIKLAPMTGSANLKWRLVNKGGLYSVQPISDPSLALSVPGAKSESGSRVAVTMDQAQDTQRWSIVASGNGACSLLPQFNTGIGLDDFGGNATPAAVIDIWNYNSADPHLQWTITPAP